MGLICNGYRNGHSPFRYGSGALVSIYGGAVTRRNGDLPGRQRNWNTHTTRDVALPMGNLAPDSWMLPRTGGGMSMRALAQGALVAGLIPSYPMSIDLTGSSDFDATAALVVSMLLAMTGAGSMTAAIEGRLNMSADLTGSGDLAADLAGIASMAIDLLGAGDLEATIAAYGNMEIDIVVTGTGLSTANVGQAVWSAVAASNNDPGTMGEKLNDAGSASNPWTEVIESGLTAAQVLRLIAAVVQGDASGLESGAPTYKSIDGTTDRVIGTYVTGTRTITTRDPD